MKARGAKTLSGQANIMEYVLMTFFIFIIVVALIIFLSAWQVSQMEITSLGSFSERAIENLDSLKSTMYLLKGASMSVTSMLDDSKLTALMHMDNLCDNIEKLFGSNFYFEVRAFEYSESAESSDKECTLVDYLDCNHWSFCRDEDRPATSYVMPVNIYRKTLNDGRTDIGMLRVGVYGD